MLGYKGEPGVMILTMQELFDRIHANSDSRSINLT